jgi:hypothetical protein
MDLASAETQRRCSYSTRELQAAAVALAAGQFSYAPAATSRATAPAAAEVGGRREAGHRDRRVAGAIAMPVVPMMGALVRVRAANTGAGAPTVALALADAADGAGLRTRVLDAAAPAWSGLIGASVTELGAREGGVVAAAAAC